MLSIFKCLLLFSIIVSPVFAAEQTPPLIQQLKTTEIKLSTLALDYEKTLKEIAKQEPILATLTEQETLMQQKNQAQHAAITAQIRQSYIPVQSTSLKNLLNQDDSAKTNRRLNYQRHLINARLTKLQQTNSPPLPNQPTVAALTNQLNQLKTRQLQQRQELEDLQRTRAAILVDPEFIPHSHPYNLEKLLTSFNLAPNKNLSLKKAMRPLCIKKTSPTEGAMEKFDKKTGSVLIDATENQDVRAIAKGRIIYADWLEGYGLLLIIDHGRGFVSLYGRNHNFYKTTGARVNAGDIIASVGNTGGYETPALYFAIKYNNHPTNPAKWCKNNS